jgi:uncharacterized RDD family membrane protein YckC
MRIPGIGSKSEDSDWAKELAGHVTRVVDSIHDAAVVPLTTVVRAIVFGTLAAIVGISASVLFAIAIVRVLDVYLDNIPGFPEGVWVAHLFTGAIFVIVSLLFWGKRSARNN